MTIGSEATNRTPAPHARHQLACKAPALGALTLCVALLAAACGSHTDAKADKPSGVSGKAGSSSHAGSGEATAGTGTAGMASLPRGPRIECGTFLCTGPMSTLGGLLGGLVATPVPCCVDTAQGSCGYAASSGAACEPIAVPDERCPSIDLSALTGPGGLATSLGISSVAGCCIEDMCGVDGAVFGRGCVENSQAKIMLGQTPIVGGLATVPEPQPCQ